MDEAAEFDDGSASIGGCLWISWEGGGLPESFTEREF
jgi:hypothetical protein